MIPIPLSLQAPAHAITAYCSSALFAIISMLSAYTISSA